MKNYRLTMILICWMIWIVDGTQRRIKKETTQKFHRTGEPIALDNLLQKYEREHQEFCKKEINGDDYLEWPSLNNKNLSDYCRKYLCHSIPTRKSTNVTGIKIRKTLHYEKQNASITSEVVVVQCKLTYKNSPSYYYITRAPESHCVYALKSKGSQSYFILVIIYKHCGFENNTEKKNIEEVISIWHYVSGQPIAKDKYLLDYELEHQKLFSRKDEEEKPVAWPHITVNCNIDSYCYQYLGKCAPTRRREAVSGSWKTDKLHYQKLNTNTDIHVTIVTCLPSKMSQRRYHITRAPETNCVYALLRKQYRAHLVIIFKHCDFVDLNYQHITSQDYYMPVENMKLKSEIKKETIDTLETLQLFPQYNYMKIN